MKRQFLPIFIFIFVIISSMSLGVFYYIFNNQCIDFSLLEHYNPGQATILLDDQGVEWARFQYDKREPVFFEKMPQHLVDAFIAAEDWSFFSHQGISYKGIVRSIIVNLYYGRKVQGASTITQQLVKLLFFDHHKTFSRKFKEQIFALIIERQFTKQHILQTYLNHIYFGCGIYGVQAACQRFWNIDAADISIDQAATLAAIVRSPAQYCPIFYPLSCQKRRNIVLQLMCKKNFITTAQYHNACARSINILLSDSDAIALHLRETIRVFLENKLGKQELYRGGFIVQTTMNRGQQLSAQNAFYEQCKKLKKELNPAIDGAMITIEAKTGEIKALVGGYDFNESQWNRALQARRQIGSTIKPLIYAVAMDKGFSFAQTDYDEPFSLVQGRSLWEPKNYNKRFNGQITLAYALSWSNNIVAIKTLMKVGAQNIVNLAKKCHIKGPFHTYPSLALGTVDASLIEVVGMFNIFACNGIYREPYFIRWIKNASGVKVFKKRSEEKHVLPSVVNDQVAQVLMHGLQRLQRNYHPSRWLVSEAIGKTGTTNDSRICWFVGSTPSLTTAVYIGFDDNTSMGVDIYPVKTAFPVWLAFHCANPDQQKKFVFDPRLEENFIDQYTGLPVDKHDHNAIKILLKKDTT